MKKAIIILLIVSAIFLSGCIQAEPKQCYLVGEETGQVYIGHHNGFGYDDNA